MKFEKCRNSDKPAGVCESWRCFGIEQEQLWQETNFSLKTELRSVNEDEFTTCRMLDKVAELNEEPFKDDRFVEFEVL